MTAAEQILRIIRDHGPVGDVEIAQRMGIGIGATNGVLLILVSAGRVRQRGAGYYELTKLGRKWIDRVDPPSPLPPGEGGRRPGEGQGIASDSDQAKQGTLPLFHRTTVPPIAAELLRRPTENGAPGDRGEHS